VNRLLLHIAIVLSVLCLAVVSPLVPILAAAEQSDAAQRHLERGTALLRKGDLAAASETARKAIGEVERYRESFLAPAFHEECVFVRFVTSLLVEGLS